MTPPIGHRPRDTAYRTPPTGRCWVVLSKMKEHTGSCSKYQDYVQEGLKNITKNQPKAVSSVPKPFKVEWKLQSSRIFELEAALWSSLQAMKEPDQEVAPNTRSPSREVPEEHYEEPAQGSQVTGLASQRPPTDCDCIVDGDLPPDSDSSSLLLRPARDCDWYSFCCPYCSQPNFDQDGLVEHCTSLHARDPRQVVSISSESALQASYRDLPLTVTGPRYSRDLPPTVTGPRYSRDLPLTVTGPRYSRDLPPTVTGPRYSRDLPLTVTGPRYSRDLPLAVTGPRYSRDLPLTVTGPRYSRDLPLTVTGPRYSRDLPPTVIGSR
ncbi:hypothetical protein NFI96_005991 [Prochilodus magdalenae]|nr:hypothetical protein NFI96_005991 [Prochilodus magdalenae]